MESTKPTENLAECGNKSKPLLCDVISLELKKVWYERKQNIENKEIAEGLEIEYYGEKNRMIHNPSRGEIKKKTNKDFILNGKIYQQKQELIIVNIL